MLRRTAFIAVTVFMFEYPVLQMIVHQLLTMATLVYLCHGNIFESQLRKCIEIFSEAMLLLSSIVLQNLMRRDFTDEAMDFGEKLFIELLVMLLLTNIGFMIATVITNKKEAKR